MNRNLMFILLLGCAMAFTSCAPMVTSSSLNISDGFYTIPAGREYYSLQENHTIINNLPDRKKVFLFSQGDTLFIIAADTNAPFPQAVNFVHPFAGKQQNMLLTDHSYDIDVFTTPFKFRKAAAGIPAQVTTSFNAALYTGYRFDRYAVKRSHMHTPFNLSRSSKTGFGIGAFVGMGSIDVKPEFTRNMITYEYEALSLSYGVAVLLGYRNINTGIACGFDHITDANGKNWIYQDKPWLGVFIGLNLN